MFINIKRNYTLFSFIQFYYSPSLITFFGSDDIAFPTLQKLYSKHPVEVVTHYTKPKIKIQNKVQQFAKKHSLNLYTPITKTHKQQKKQQWKKFQIILSQKKRDLGIILSYGYMIPDYIIQKFNKGIIIIHPSLLPKYRGGAPIFHAIANGDKSSGISYIQISSKKFDAGNILYQVQAQIPQDKRYKQIQQMFAQLAANHVNHKLRPGIKQTLQGTSAPIYKDSFLNLNQDLIKVYNLSRAIKKPRLKFNQKDIIVKFKKCEYVYDGQIECGTIICQKKRVFVRCKDGFLELVSWQEPSKGQMAGSVFAQKYGIKQKNLRFK